MKVTSIVLAGGILFTAPLHAGSAYDGTYSGSMVVTKGEAFCIPLQPVRTATIVDGVFTMVYKPSGSPIHGTVTSDGTVKGFGATPSGGVNFNGRFVNGVLIADTVDTACGYHVEMKRS